VKIGAKISISTLYHSSTFPFIPIPFLYPISPHIRRGAYSYGTGQASRLHFQRKKAMEGLAI
jgi:hypothetical protein